MLSPLLEEKLSHIKTPVTLSIIGCVVNGPGEAAMTDVGITGGGKGNNMLYLSGIQNEKVLTNDIVDRVVAEVENQLSSKPKTEEQKVLPGSSQPQDLGTISYKDTETNDGKKQANGNTTNDWEIKS